DREFGALRFMDGDTVSKAQLVQLTAGVAHFCLIEAHPQTNAVRHVFVEGDHFSDVSVVNGIFRVVAQLEHLVTEAKNTVSPSELPFSFSSGIDGLLQFAVEKVDTGRTPV